MAKVDTNNDINKLNIQFKEKAIIMEQIITQIHQPEEGILIVLAFKGTTEEFFKQIGQGKIKKIDAPILTGIGCCTWAAINSGIGINEIKLCCAGDFDKVK